jgi:hypothetical protein
MHNSPRVDVPLRVGGRMVFTAPAKKTQRQDKL